MATEKRLIDKDALIALCDAPHWCVWMSEIEDFPTVDAVEVVRCKDCKYRKQFQSDGTFYCSDPNYGMGIGVELQDDDFCSYGERRE